MKFLLFWTAVTGWFLAIIVHIMAICKVDVEAHVPYIWLLHLGIFLVWIPAILLLRKRPELAPLKRSGVRPGMNASGLFKTLSKSAPKWVAVAAGLGMVYAFINFALFFFQLPGTPGIKEGQYYLHNHGQFLRNITEQEYHYYKSLTVRGFSGHWIAFYGIAAAVLYPYKEETT